MSTTKHTAEPWTSEGKGVFGANRKVVMVAMCGDPIRAEDAPTAARIVACVNACAGVEDPAAALTAAREALEWFRANAQRLSLSYEEARADEALRGLLPK